MINHDTDVHCDPQHTSRLDKKGYVIPCGYQLTLKVVDKGLFKIPVIRCHTGCPPYPYFNDIWIGDGIDVGEIKKVCKHYKIKPDLSSENPLEWSGEKYIL